MRLALASLLALLLSAVIAPVAAADQMVALVNDGNTIATFDTDGPIVFGDRRGDAPGVTVHYESVRGLQFGETLRAIDARPETITGGRVFALAVANTAGTDTGRVYQVDPGTGQAVPIPNHTTPFSTTLADGAYYGMDFDPISQNLRIVNSADQNLRINMATGALTTDTALDHPVTAESIPAIAYDRSAPSQGATTLFGIDFSTDSLVRIGDVDGTPASPNGGVVHDIGALNPLTGNQLIGMDIARDGTAWVSMLESGGENALYTVNLGTGGLTKQTGLGTISLVDIAVIEPALLGFEQSSLAVPESIGGNDSFLQFVRGGDASHSVGVHYATAAGTATPGKDYFDIGGDLEFSPSTTGLGEEVPIVNDDVDEPDETFTVTLSNPVSGAVLTSPSTVTVTIVDDDPPPAVAPPPPPPPPAPPAADSSAPTVSLASVPRSMKLARFLRGLTFAVTPSEAASIEASLLGSARRATVAKAYNLTLATRPLRRAAGRRSVRLKPNRRLVGRARRFTVQVRVLATDAAGNRRTVTRTIKVSR